MNKWIVPALLFVGFLAVVVWETSKLEKVMGAKDYLHLGIAKGSLGLHEEAIDLFRKGLNENPNLVTAYFFLGIALIALVGKYLSPVALGPRTEGLPLLVRYFCLVHLVIDF